MWLFISWCCFHLVLQNNLNSCYQRKKENDQAQKIIWLWFTLSHLSSSVYSPDMPSRLPIQDICAGLLTSVGTAIRYWFHYTLVAFAWLGVVPLTACKYPQTWIQGEIIFKTPLKRKNCLTCISYLWNHIFVLAFRSTVILVLMTNLFNRFGSKYSL